MVSEFGDRGICHGFGTSEFGDHGVCDGFGTNEFGDHGVPRLCTTKVDFPATEAPGVRSVLRCTTKVDFPATEAPGVPGVIRLYYKSRLSSHGSSGRPRRTTFVLQKSTFQPLKLRASAAYYVCTKKSTFQPRKLRASPVPGVLR